MPLNRPHRQELLTAVTDYLRQPPADTEADRFYRRVAANVLAIVQREELQAPGFQQLDARQLQTFLASNETDPDILNKTLCSAIENGHTPINPALTGMLLQLARAKLEIDNPKYNR